jgi:hypothetical protein
MFRRMLGACVVLVWTLTLPACAALVPPYSAEAIEARVVDADTKQPLEGVIVTANWELRGGGLALGGSTAVGQIQVMEAVTDQNGRFFFPAWGPIKQFKGELHDKDPQLLFFKSGYAYRILWNDYRGDPPAMKVVHRSQWNGKTIEMKKFMGTPAEWLKVLERSIPPYEHREDARKSVMLKAILAEEDSIPDSTPRKRPFFDNIVRRLLEGR